MKGLRLETFSLEMISDGCASFVQNGKFFVENYNTHQKCLNSTLRDTILGVVHIWGLYLSILPVFLFRMCVSCVLTSTF